MPDEIKTKKASLGEVSKQHNSVYGVDAGGESLFVQGLGAHGTNSGAQTLAKQRYTQRLSSG